MKNQAGFTLIEVIVTLILVGIVALMGGMAIVQVTQGYIFTKDNAELTQKAQLATSRITKEIVEMSGISANATATSLPLKNNIRNVTIGLDAGSIKIAPAGAALSAGDILVDNVNAFTLTYYSKDSSGNWVANTSWSTASDIRNLIAIDISMQLPRSGGGYLTFQNRISPRNNKNQGGTVPTTPPPTAPNYGFGCFVATAAYGAADHPMVMLLRDFRDRYLLTWPGGRWLAKQYYTHGPAAADMIRNRPVAMWAVRCLLAPLAALTFCLVYAPLAIPFLVVISLVLTGALFSVGRRGQIKLPILRFMNQRGSVLIGLIGTMVVMGVLGAAMLPIFSASYMNQAFADQGRKTYFLAESGFRYAASQFLNVGTEAAKETALTNLNNKTCNLSGNGGSFTIRVYPYWSKTSSVSGGTTLSTTIAGTNPSNTTPPKRILSAGGYLKIDGAYYSFTNDTGSSGTTVVYTGLSPAMASVPATPVDVLPVVLPASTQTVTNGGNLTLSATGAGAFPVFNGNFKLNGGGMVYSYEKRSDNTLINISLADSTKTWADFTVTSGAITTYATTKIVLDKYLQISSTGNLGNNSREILYNVPVGWLTGGGQFNKQQDYDPNMAGWVPPTGGDGGTHSVQTFDGGDALKVESTVSVGSGDHASEWAMAFFNGYSNTSLAQSWYDAQGFLSYDLQMKAYNTQPYFFAGMNFRARNESGNLYSYGVSLVRARQQQNLAGNWENYTLLGGGEADLIENELIPGAVQNSTSGLYSTADGRPLEATSDWWYPYRYSKPAIVLWKNTSTGIQWLAYRTLTEADGIVTYNSGSHAYRLVNWSTLMVRVAEGYSLTFGNGGGLVNPGVPIKEGDIIETVGHESSARVVMTPILTGGSWTSRNATGTLILANIVTGSTAIGNGVPLYVNGVQLASATGGIVATKKNYIRVYYTRPTAQGTANASETDNNRLANPRGNVNWPPDDLTELNSTNDYVTLVQWTGTQLTSGSEMALPLTAGNWNTGTGWTFATSPNQLRKSAIGTGTAYPSTALTITAGRTYDVSITVSNWTTGSGTRNFRYTLGGVAVRTVTAAGTYTDTVTATGTGNLIFTPTNNSRFDITAVSVIPRVSIAMPSTSEPNAIIPDSDLITSAWTSTSTQVDFAGDSIALMTSSGTAKSTYYDDFAIQLDQKAGTGFLPPIQQ